MTATFFTVIVIFLMYHAESYLIKALLKVLPQQLQATLAAAFSKTP